MFFPFLMLVFSKVYLSTSVGLKKLGRFLDNFFPQQQNAVGSLHNIDFGVFWASWGGSGNRVPGTKGIKKVPDSGDSVPKVPKVTFALRIYCCTLKVHVCTPDVYFSTLKVYFCTSKVYLRPWKGHFILLKYTYFAL